MGHGWRTVHSVTMASGGSLTSAIDLGRAYPSVYVEISSSPSQSEHRFLAAASLGGVYNTIYHPAINSATVACNIYKIPSGVTGALVPVPGGFQFMKVFATAAMDNGTVYRIHVGDD